MTHAADRKFNASFKVDILCGSDIDIAQWRQEIVCWWLAKRGFPKKNLTYIF